MIKRELVKKISEVSGVKSKDVAKVIDAFAGVTINALKNGEDVNIPGLGKFKVKVRKPRKGYNIRKGEVIEIPEKKVIAFRPNRNIKSI